MRIEGSATLPVRYGASSRAAGRRDGLDIVDLKPVSPTGERRDQAFRPAGKARRADNSPAPTFRPTQQTRATLVFQGAAPDMLVGLQQHAQRTEAYVPDRSAAIDAYQSAVARGSAVTISALHGELRA